MKLYYITRTFYPHQKGGGPLMRAAAVDKLRELGWDVVVVMPGYRQIKVHESDNLIQIPTLPILKITRLLQKVGLLEDYLDLWVRKSLKYLKNVVKKGDLVFATSGGELGTLKLAALLKSETGCTAVLNFRDPLEYALCHNLLIDNSYHVSREKSEKKYLSAADLLVTSSQHYKSNLIDKYPEFAQKVINNYFGFFSNLLEVQRINERDDSIIRICYMGTMTNAQKPEILIEAFLSLASNIKNKIELVFIGNHKPYCEFDPYRNTDKILFLDYMSSEELKEYIQANIHIGFVSLVKDYYGACVPSKIYEYINFELPILAALPSGDGLDIVNDNKFGLACKYNNTSELQNNIERMTDPVFLDLVRNKLKTNKNAWSMDTQIKTLNSSLSELIKQEPTL